MALRSFGGRQARLTVAASAIAAIVVAAVISARVLCPLASAQQSDLPQGDMQWPTYMHDRYRSGITASSLPLPLSLKWAFRAPGPPVTAWPEPPPEPVEGVLERPKVNFDDAYHVAVVGDRVFFGTSEDNKVYCLDATSGALVWDFFTDGPVRLAPTVHQGRVYVGSDDGNVYCLSADNGKLIWKFTAAPTPQCILGRGKMTSLWAVRTGVLVDDGTAYFGAGIFPAERVFIYAVRSSDGSLVWKNDSVSDANSGFSPQGYLLMTDEYLFFPSGRALPACFRRDSGKFEYQTAPSWRTWGPVGGTFALIADDRLVVSGSQSLELERKSGAPVFAWYEGKRLLVTKTTSYMLGDNGISALDRVNYARLKNEQKSIADARAALEKQKPKDLQQRLKDLDEQEKRVTEELKKCTLWSLERKGLETIIIAGDLLVAGGAGEVLAVDRATGQILWRGEVDGMAKGLAVAGGRLLVSTTTGAIYCFAPGAPGRAVHIPSRSAAAFPRDAASENYSAAAKEILALSGVKKGYCLVLNAGNGRLAWELARNSDLRIYGAEADPARVAAARRALDEAGVYGRVCIDQAPSDALPYPDYFANLVVCDEAVVSGRITASAREAWRCLKPCGGVLIIGSPSGALSEATIKAWLASADINDYQILRTNGLWAKVIRGAIPGSDWWTHQYGTPGNICSSNDTAVRLPLGVLWYGDPGPATVPSRHARNVAPLCIDGRVYLQGINHIYCFDAYNGVMYWHREIPGAYRVNSSHEASNIACRSDSLFVATGAKCLRLDARTGETVATFELPPGANPDGKHVWAYVAVVGDQLFGSSQIRSQLCDAIFAYDVSSGRLQWVRKVTDVRNTTIAIDGGRMFFAEPRPASEEQRRQACGPRIAELRSRLGITNEQAEEEIKKADVCWAVALDIRTGKTLWEKPVDVTKCYDVGRGGGALFAMAHRGALVFSGTHGDGHYWSDFLGGSYVERRAVVLSEEDGSLLWTKPIGCRIKPLIVGDTLYAEPWAFDLHTGKQKMRIHPLTGKPTVWEMERPGHHCGCIVGSPNALFFRSWSTGYYDLIADHGTEHFGAQRPGCWVNTIPAGGIMVEPEASSGCQCLHAFQVTLAFEPRGPRKTWGLFCSRGESLPVKQLYVNLGAPGDRRDEKGRLWLSMPRPWGRMRLDVPLNVSLFRGPGYVNSGAELLDAPGAEVPWVFASGCYGDAEYSLQLANPEDGPALYSVRLAFFDRNNSRRGQRVFDIKLQGKTVLEGFDPVAAAGGPGKPVVREFKSVRVDDGKLVIALATKVREPKDNQWPLLNAIEIQREKVLSVGLSAPSLVLGDLDKAKILDVAMANRTEQAFDGRLEIIAPPFVSVTPATVPVSIGVDEKKSVAAKLSVAQPSQPGSHEVRIRLARPDGTTEIERVVPLEYLGRRGRIVVPVAEDAYVIANNATGNYGSEGAISVDGGSSRLRDEAWAIGYLKFKFHVPGKPVAVKLRIFVTPNPNAESGDSGRICLAEAQWRETTITFANQPRLGRQVAVMGPVPRGEAVERLLDVDLSGKTELSLAIDPTTTDGASYYSREGGKPAELIIDYVPE